MAAMRVRAPEDKGVRGRISWLVNQIKGAPPDLIIESYPKNAQTPTTSTLDDALDDRGELIGDQRREAYRFRVVQLTPMGTVRKANRRNSFIDSVLALIDGFYESVVQEISEWQPPTPRKKQVGSAKQVEELPPASEDQADLD